MEQSQVLKRKASAAAVSAVVVLALAFAVNAYHQAEQYRRALASRATLAAFVKADSPVAHEVIGERIINLDHVLDVGHIPKEQALEQALGAGSFLKDVLIPGENPFTAYFVVRPGSVDVSTALALKDQLGRIEGIDDVRFDEPLFSLTGQLAVFVRAYRLAGTALALVVLAAIIVRLTWRIVGGRSRLRKEFFTLAAGVAGGIAGIGLYLLAVRLLGSPETIRIPLLYLPYLAAAGVATAFLGDSE